MKAQVPLTETERRALLIKLSSHLSQSGNLQLLLQNSALKHQSDCAANAALTNIRDGKTVASFPWPTWAKAPVLHLWRKIRPSVTRIFFRISRPLLTRYLRRLWLTG